MSLLTVVADVLGVRTELRRIADALERMAPMPDATPVEAIPPEEAVTYVNEEEMTKQELREQMSVLERARQEHPEWFTNDEHDANDTQDDTSTRYV